MLNTKSYFLKAVLLSSFFCANCLWAESSAVDSLLKTGNDYTVLFQHDKAYEQYKKATDLAPNNWEAWFLSGKALIKLKRIDEAEKALIKAHKLKSDEVDLQKALGSIYINYAKNALNQGNLAKKVEYQLKACHAYPGASKIWLSLFEDWWEKAEFDKIKSEGDFLVKNNSNILEEGQDQNLQEAILFVAKAYFSDGDYSKAESYLNFASKIRVHNDELQSLKREIRNKAEENVKKILEQAEDQVRNKKYDEAVKTLETASKLPGARKSEIEDRIESIRKSISLTKSKEEIDSLIVAKNYEKAMTLLEEALGNFPDSEEIGSRYDQVSKIIADIQEEKEKAEEAKNAAEMARTRKAQKAALLVKEANRFEEEKNYEAAIASLEKASDLQPDDADLKVRIEGLKLENKKARERQNRFTNSITELKDQADVANYQSVISLGSDLLLKYPEHKSTVAPILVEAYIKSELFDEASKTVESLAEEEQYADLYNYTKGLKAYNEGNSAEASEFFGKITSTSSKYYKEASSYKFKLTLIKMQYGAYLVLLIVIIIAIPKIKEYKRNSTVKKNNEKLDKIKESGSYEANFAFLKERYENDDVDNRKLATLLYAAALQKKGDNALSYKLITEYLKKDSRSPLAKNIAGETAMALGKTDAVDLENIQNLLKINENRTDAIHYLAYSYMALRADHKLAQDYISKSLALNSSDKELLNYLADVYIARGVYSNQTVKTFEKAIKGTPDKIDYYIALMENYKAIGNYAEAERVATTMKEKFPQAATEAPETAMNQPVEAYNTFETAEHFETAGQGVTAEPVEKQPTFSSPFANVSLGENSDSNLSNGGLPDYSSLDLGLDFSSNQSLPSTNEISGETAPQTNSQVASVKPTAVQTAPRISGPKKNCPHCGAVNAANEYYCTTCGKPF